MVLEGIDDDMDELAVGGAVPARPEACVAVEAPTPDGRRVGAASPEMGDGWILPPLLDLEHSVFMVS